MPVIQPPPPLPKLEGSQFKGITQALRDDTKNACVAGYTSNGRRAPLSRVC